MKKFNLKELADYIGCSVQNLYYMKKTNPKKFELLKVGFLALGKSNDNLL